MNNEPDLITLLMAVGLLHVYNSFSKEELLLLLAVDSYKNTLMMVPYEDPNYKINRDVRHIMRVLKAHELTYTELLRKC